VLAALLPAPRSTRLFALTSIGISRGGGEVARADYREGALRAVVHDVVVGQRRVGVAGESQVVAEPGAGEAVGVAADRVGEPGTVNDVPAAVGELGAPMSQPDEVVLVPVMDRLPTILAVFMA